MLPSLSHAAEFCDQSRDPHSYQCAEDTYNGRIFPLAFIRSENVAFDSWNLLTFAEPNGRGVAEFIQLTNARNPRIPTGLMNRLDQSRVGFLQWSSAGIIISNWRMQGNSIFAHSNNVTIFDEHTINVVLGNQQERQSLTCRIFLRERKDHLLCGWFTDNGREFAFRGYLGFGTSR
jgi:hypothetical protein